LGDAAATASFLRGKGVNFAIDEALAAGQLIRSKLSPSGFLEFEIAMKQITDNLIEDSAFLFD